MHLGTKFGIDGDDANAFGFDDVQKRSAIRRRVPLDHDDFAAEGRDAAETLIHAAKVIAAAVVIVPASHDHAEVQRFTGRREIFSVTQSCRIRRASNNSVLVIVGMSRVQVSGSESFNSHISEKLLAVMVTPKRSG